MSEPSAEEKDLAERLAKVRGERKARDRAEKIARFPTKCCRCWPNLVSDAGFCGCCYMDHKTGVRESFSEPDYGFSDPMPTEEA